MSLPFVARLVIVILLTIALAEFAPDMVNAILGLILIGIVLSNWRSFQGITKIISTIGG